MPIVRSAEDEWVIIRIGYTYSFASDTYSLGDVPKGLRLDAILMAERGLVCGTMVTRLPVLRLISYMSFAFAPDSTSAIRRTFEHLGGR